MAPRESPEATAHPDPLNSFVHLSLSYSTAMAASLPLLDHSKMKLPGIQKMEDHYNLQECLWVHEIKTPLHIYQLELNDNIQVSKLHSFVSSGNKSNMKICGILVTYIKFHCTLASQEKIRKPASYLWETWIHQLEEMINEVHKAGSIWGDAEPDNVLIDMDNNLWII
ncbi:conserved hypothetical protein [Histoplasma capsulatum H143]|uniref:Protein kinase domain-containing protein n=1 Tax=Ajellomyces capsulatus (strain H143) TaxID=544712 RepID=C6H867_AJECH|nr:conserved hypothetical protein [Histoplasma capsulatum H143]